MSLLPEIEGSGGSGSASYYFSGSIAYHRLREELDTPRLPAPPVSVYAAIDIALRTRPDLRLACLIEERNRCFFKGV